MRQRRIRSCVAVALVLTCATATASALATAPASAGPSRSSLCKRFRCRTLAADVSAQVFQTSNRPKETFHENTFAQWLPNGHVTSLGDNFQLEGPVLSRLALSGRFAAYGLALTAARYQGEGSTWAVGRLNIQTGRRERFPAVGAQGGGFAEKSPGVAAVVVTAAGSMAWIDEGAFQNPLGAPLPGNEGVLPPGSRALFDLPANSKAPQVIAVSLTIDPKSVAATPGHLYWTEGVTPRSASIP